jgi:hypothetical protein
MKRILILAAAGALVVTPVLGAWAASDGARHAAGPHHHGADDAGGHVRHSGEPESGDDHAHGTRGPGDDD